jgi:hypothetical protein
MSYALGQVYTEAQANRVLGWTPKRLKSYWAQRAQACQQFSDEGECLAQLTQQGMPVTIGGMGDTASDISTALTVTAGLFRDPDGTLRQYGPPIVTAADRHVVHPLLDEVGRALTPYILKYVLPVIAGLYVTTGISAYYSYKIHERGNVRSNRRRRRRTSVRPNRRRRRRTSRR